jgi:hypothetical protein
LVCESYAKRKAFGILGVECSGNVLCSNLTHSRDEYTTDIHAEIARGIVTFLQSKILSEVDDIQIQVNTRNKTLEEISSLRREKQTQSINSVLKTLIKARSGYLGIDNETSVARAVPDIRGLYVSKVTVSSTKEDVQSKVLAENLSISSEEAHKLITVPGTTYKETVHYRESESLRRMAEIQASAHMAALATSAVYNGSSDLMSAETQAKIFSQHSAIGAALSMQTQLAATIRTLRTHSLNDQIQIVEELSERVQTFTDALYDSVMSNVDIITSEVYRTLFSRYQSTMFPMKSVGFGDAAVYHAPLMQNVTMEVAALTGTPITHMDLVPYRFTVNPMEVFKADSIPFKYERVMSRYLNVAGNLIGKALIRMIKYSQINPNQMLNAQIAKILRLGWSPDAKLNTKAAIKEFISIMGLDSATVSTNTMISLESREYVKASKLNPGLHKMRTHMSGSDVLVSGTIANREFKNLRTFLPRSVDHIFNTFSEMSVSLRDFSVDMRLVNALNLAFSPYCVFAGVPPLTDDFLPESVNVEMYDSNGFVITHSTGANKGRPVMQSFVPTLWNELNNQIESDYRANYVGDFGEDVPTISCTKYCMLKTSAAEVDAARIDPRYPVEWDHATSCDHCRVMSTAVDEFNIPKVAKS